MGIKLVNCRRAAGRILAAALVFALGIVPVWAIEPTNDAGLSDKTFEHPVLSIPHSALNPAELPADVAADAYRSLNRLGVVPQSSRFDTLGGRFETLLPSYELAGPRTAPGQTRDQRAGEVRDAFLRYLGGNRQDLGVEIDELGDGRVSVHGDGTVVQVYLPREIGGIPVLGAYVTGVVNHGKLNLFGIHRWGDVAISLAPRVSAVDANAIAADHLAPFRFEGQWGKDLLVIVPTAAGEGYGHRLALADPPPAQRRARQLPDPGRRPQRRAAVGQGHQPLLGGQGRRLPGDQRRRRPRRRRAAGMADAVHGGRRGDHRHRRQLQLDQL